MAKFNLPARPAAAHLETNRINDTDASRTEGFRKRQANGRRILDYERSPCKWLEVSNVVQDPFSRPEASPANRPEDCGASNKESGFPPQRRLVR